jgi:hypothetical protein
MLDSIPSATFWPLFAVAWFLVSLALGVFIGKVIKFGSGE